MKANASRLLARPDIQDRVRELLANAASEAKIDRSRVITMLLDDREVARTNKQAAAAIRVDELLGKAIGMFADRKEIYAVNPFEECTFEELKTIRDILVAEQQRRAALADQHDKATADSER